MTAFCLIGFVAAVSTGAAAEAAADYPRSAEPAPAVETRPTPGPLAPTRSESLPQELRFVGDTPYLGSTPLGPRRFYTELGRDDLVEELAGNRTRRNVVLIGGAVLFGIGNVIGILGYYLWLEDLMDPRFAYRHTLFTERGGPMLLTGIGVGVAGMIVAAIGYLMDPRPLSPAQERELLVEHNRRSATARPPPSKASATAGFSVSPLLLPEGGGAVLALRF